MGFWTNVLCFGVGFSFGRRYLNDQAAVPWESFPTIVVSKRGIRCGNRTLLKLELSDGEDE